MATKPGSETNGCTFQWKIENISDRWKKCGKGIQSPTFIVDALGGTKWSLKFFPMSTIYEKFSGLLQREQDCTGPDVIRVSFKVAFLARDGEILKNGNLYTESFKKNKNSHCFFETREAIFGTEWEACLPENTLTVQCTLWKENETIVKSKHISARTIFTVNRRSFVWKIDDFSLLKPGVRNQFKDDVMDIELVIKQGLHFENEVILDGISFDKSVKYISFKTAVINSDGEKEQYGAREYCEAELKKGVSLTLLLTRLLMENKSRYLPNDVLSLYFEYIYETDTVSYQFCSCGIVSSLFAKVSGQEREEHRVEQPNTQLTPVLAKDLESMYKDGVCCDTELRTSTKTFPAHKCILTARSPVFGRMFSNDMKEKNTGHVNITDFEDDIVHRMLLYIYTDSLEDLQLENACKLYAAADKYEILSLRSICSSFLKYNLTTTKACDVLVLADLHQDDDLKSAVQDFILKHDKEVFGSQEWRQFMDSNLKLAADVMFRKVSPA